MARWTRAFSTSEVRIVRSRLAILSLAAAVLSLNFGCGSDSPTSSTNPPSGPTSNPPSTAPPPAGPNHDPVAIVADRAPKQSTIVVGGTRFAVKGDATDADGDPLTYTWNWDDGSAHDTGKGASHIFNKEGEFRVELTVTDGRGGKGTAHTTISARKLSGTWRVENARHFDLSININQNNGPGVFGTMSDGAGIQGQVRDPYSLTMNVAAANGFCIPSGSYTGQINPQVTEIQFTGPGCRAFTFFR
jgi:hypothetical protein